MAGVLSQTDGLTLKGRDTVSVSADPPADPVRTMKTYLPWGMREYVTLDPVSDEIQSLS